MTIMLNIVRYYRSVVLLIYLVAITMGDAEQSEFCVDCNTKLIITYFTRKIQNRILKTVENTWKRYYPPLFFLFNFHSKHFMSIRNVELPWPFLNLSSLLYKKLRFQKGRGSSMFLMLKRLLESHYRGIKRFIRKDEGETRF